MITNTNNDNGSTFDKDKVLGRVKKMLALAADSAASEGERDNAMRMAHATLAKYNLSLGDAQKAHTSPTEKRGEESVEDWGYPWARQTAYAVAQLCFCEYFFMRVRGRADKCRHYYVGRASNVVTAREMTAYVIDSILKEANKRRREEYQDWSWWTSFCKGAAYAVHTRCLQLRKEAEEASNAAPTISSGTSLVLASVYATEQAANKAYLEQHHKLRTEKSREHRAGAGWSDGKAHGDSISLHRQVGSGNSSKQLR